MREKSRVSKDLKQFKIIQIICRGGCILNFYRTKNKSTIKKNVINCYLSDERKNDRETIDFLWLLLTNSYLYYPRFGEEVRIIHFIGITKPWLQYFDTLTGIVQPPAGSGHLQPLLQLWWNIFCEKVHPQLSASMVSSINNPRVCNVCVF